VWFQFDQADNQSTANEAAQYTSTQITITTTRSSAKPATVVEFSDGNQLSDYTTVTEFA